MGTLRSHRLFIEQLVLVLREPHELEALRAATDLRCHHIPRTLGFLAPLTCEETL